jgi:hypothetical protein
MRLIPTDQVVPRSVTTELAGKDESLLPTISAAQRDALYDRFLSRLSGIEDIWIAASQGDLETADRLCGIFLDDMRLVVDDLGWGDRPDRAELILTTDPAVLRRIFGRLKESAATERDSESASWEEMRVAERRNRLVSAACESVLGGLGQGG